METSPAQNAMPSLGPVEGGAFQVPDDPGSTESVEGRAIQVPDDPGTAAYGPCSRDNPACGGGSGLCSVSSSGFHRCTPLCNADSECPVPGSGAATPECILSDLVVNGMAGQCALQCEADGDCPQDGTCMAGSCEFSNLGIEGFPQPDPCSTEPEAEISVGSLDQDLACDAFVPEAIITAMETPRRAVWSHTDNPADGDFVSINFDMPEHEQAKLDLDLRFGSQGGEPNRGRFAREFELGSDIIRGVVLLKRERPFQRRPPCG